MKKCICCRLSHQNLELFWSDADFSPDSEHFFTEGRVIISAVKQLIAESHTQMKQTVL